MLTETKNIKDLSAADRPREKLLQNGAKELTNTELIAILLGSGGQGLPLLSICQSLIEITSNDMFKLAEMSIKDIQSLKGIGPAKAILLLAAIEFGRRSLETSEPLNLKEDTAVEHLIAGYITDDKNIQYHLVILNKRSELLATSYLHCEKGMLPDIKEIIKLCLDAGTTGLILCRNDIKIPARYIDKEKAFIIQLDAAASMFKMNMRGLLVIAGKT